MLVRRPDRQFVMISMQRGEPRPVAELTPEDTPIRWSAHGRGTDAPRRHAVEGTAAV
jgi:hypothetical protein